MQTVAVRCMSVLPMRQSAAVSGKTRNCGFVSEMMPSLVLDVSE